MCPNVIFNETLVRSTFPQHNWATTQPVMYHILEQDQVNTGCSRGVVSNDPACIGDFCRGLPNTVRKCLSEDAAEVYKLGISGNGEDGSLVPAALVQLTISMAAVGQIVLMVLVAPLADYGYLRKRLMTVCTLLGGISVMCMIVVTPETYWLGCIIIVVSSAFFALSQVLMYAYLPVLLHSIPSTIDRSNVCCPWGPLGVWTRLPDQDLNSDSHESLRVLNQRGTRFQTPASRMVTLPG